MGILKYKDYIGTVDYSEKDNVFFGKIEGIRSCILFEGETVQDLRDSFTQAVDEYLETCKEMGINPEKTYSGVLNIRMKPEIHRAISNESIESGKTINALINETLEHRFSKSF